MSHENEQLIALQLRDHVRGEAAKLPDADLQLVESLAWAIRSAVAKGEAQQSGLGQLALALASVELQAIVSEAPAAQTGSST